MAFNCPSQLQFGSTSVGLFYLEHFTHTQISKLTHIYLRCEATPTDYFFPLFICIYDFLSICMSEINVSQLSAYRSSKHLLSRASCTEKANAFPLVLRKFVERFLMPL